MMLPILALFTAVCSPPTAPVACGCATRDQAPAEAYRRASAVVRGRVIAEGERPATPERGGGHFYTVVVAARWKGSVGDTLTIHTEYPTSSCHTQLHVGTEYVLYPRGNGSLYLVPCFRSVPVAQAREDLEWLGQSAYRRSPLRGAP